MAQEPSEPLLLCVGDIDMDLILKVPHLPGRDEKVDGRLVARTPGGMAANVAVGTSRLGGQVRLLGAVGDDAMGQEALDALARERVDLGPVVVKQGASTFFCVIMVDGVGEKSLVKAVSPAYLPTVADLRPEVFAGAAHVHLTFTRFDVAAAASRLAREAGASLSLDLEAADIGAAEGLAELLAGVDILFLSEGSRRLLTATLGALPDLGPRLVVTTRGADGASVECGDERTVVSGHRVDVVDTSGAGDAFAAAFLHAHLRGRAPVAALRFANAAAALSTRAHGAQAGLPTGAEVAFFLNGNERGDA